MGLKANTILDLPCIVNIGLSADCDAKGCDAARANEEAKRLAIWYEALRCAGAGRIALQSSATEPTLVAYLQQAHYRPWLRTLADQTQQNCIAVYYPTIRQGCLVGYNPQAYGKFVREFFVLFDGTRLSESSL